MSMGSHDARFYFANLCADVTRLIAAAESGDAIRYARLRTMANRTLKFLREAGNRSAYEEGLLLMRGLSLANEQGTLSTFCAQLPLLLK